jgi:hypothetical protein
MRLTISILAASAALTLSGAATAQSPYGYWYAQPAPQYAPPQPQYAPPQAPYWSVAYDPFFRQPMWGYGYGYQQPAPAWPTAYAGAPMPQAWPTAYAGAPQRPTPRARTTRARDPFWSVFDDPFFTEPFFAGSLFDDPFFTEPWGFGWPSSYAGTRRAAAPRGSVMAGAGAPSMGRAWAGMPSMLGYDSFGSDDFWNWARFGDFGDSAWAGSSASAYSYTARNSNGGCVRVVRTTRNGQTVTERENCGAGPGAVYDDGYDDFDD